MTYQKITIPLDHGNRNMKRICQYAIPLKKVSLRCITGLSTV